MKSYKPVFIEDIVVIEVWETSHCPCCGKETAPMLVNVIRMGIEEYQEKMKRINERMREFFGDWD